TEKDALERLQRFHAVVRHHLTGLGKAVARPVEVGEFELEVEAPCRGFQHAHALGQDFLAYSITRNESDLVLGHVFPLLAPKDVYSTQVREQAQGRECPTTSRSRAAPSSTALASRASQATLASRTARWSPWARPTARRPRPWTPPARW